MKNKRKTRRENLKRDNKKLPFAAAAISVDIDKNLHLIYRSLANFGGKEFFVLGSNRWFKGGTNGVDDLIPVHHFSYVNNLLEEIRNKGYSIVAVEQSENSVDLRNVKEFPKNPCFLFGNEGLGLPGDVLLNSDLIVEIINPGVHPCMNVGVSSGVVMYDFIQKLL